MRFIFCIICLLASWLSYATTQEAAWKNLSAEKISCENMVEDFCHDLWREPYLGDIDLKSGDYSFSVRTGQTENGIPWILLTFLKQVQKKYNDFPADIRKAFDQIHLKQKLEAYIHRKKIKNRLPQDLLHEEFYDTIIEPINDALWAVAKIRTNKEKPGYIRMRSYEIPSELSLLAYKNESLAWSDFFVTVWSGSAQWRAVQKLFSDIQQEYISMLEADTDMPPELKKESIENLRTVKLVIPGENPRNANSSRWHRCGIDTDNAFYVPTDHEITVCAGSFNSTDSLLTLAHEMGHSFSLARRRHAYWRKSNFGKDLIGLYAKSCTKQHMSCNEWSDFKADIMSSMKNLKSYTYEDDNFLRGFITQKLKQIPEGKEMSELIERSAKTTVREEINEHELEKILKSEEILSNGKRIPNFRYLAACLNSGNWATDNSALYSDSVQFELFFAEDYSCRLQNAENQDKALSESINVAEDMIKETELVSLTVPGIYNSSQLARNEDFAQDIEEDVVDHFASRVTAKILSRLKDRQEIRTRYLGSVAGFCNYPSFTAEFPKETAILNTFTNRSHSIGLERRMKLLTPQIREALQCQ